MNSMVCDSTVRSSDAHTRLALTNTMEAWKHGSMEAWKHGSIADSLERCPEPREWQSDPRPHDGEDAIVPGRQNYVP